MTKASCQCGQLSLMTDSDPLRVSVCHCNACKRRTGSAFGTQLRYLRANVAVRGESRKYQRTADSGNLVSQCFCPQCGSTVYLILAGLDDQVIVPFGNLADQGNDELQSTASPSVSIYEERACDWLKLTGEIEHLN